MGDDLAASNVNRLHSLAATSIAIFTFMLIFLYPRFASDEVNAWLFQVTLVVMGVATFAFVFASFYYYGSSLGGRRIDDAERARYSNEGLFETSTTTEAPSIAAATPSPVMVLTPRLGDAATAS